MLSDVIPQCLVTDRITIKLQLTGKSRLMFKLSLVEVSLEYLEFPLLKLTFFNAPVTCFLKDPKVFLCQIS